jgi:Flp pilus assembly protein TadB
MFVNFIAFHPWVLIGVVALGGLSLGMLVQIQRERREAARRNRAQAARRLKASQDELNVMLSAAWASAQGEMRRDRIESAKKCGCADCRAILLTLTAN